MLAPADAWAMVPTLVPLLAEVPVLCLNDVPTVMVYGPLPETADTVTISPLLPVSATPSEPVSSWKWSSLTGGSPELSR